MGWKGAICNEMFGKMDFAQSCELVKSYGFAGMEIAPFTIGDDRGRLSDARIYSVRKALLDTGLQFAGFHWLFAYPLGFETTSPDKAKQDQAKHHLEHLLDVSGALGGGNLVFGSPKQRQVSDTTPREGRARLQEFLAGVADHAQRCNSIICIEALPAKDTNVLNVLEEAKEMIGSIGRVAIQGMFDFHNCADESLPWETLIEHHYPIIQHIHLNNPDGGHPTLTDSALYRKAFETMAEKHYSGWVSLEIFTTPENPKMVLEETKRFLDHMQKK